MIPAIVKHGTRKGRTPQHATLHETKDGARRAIQAWRGMAGWHTAVHERRVKADCITMVVWAATAWGPEGGQA